MSTRWIPSGPATRPTRTAGRSRSRSGDFRSSRAPAACPSWTDAIRVAIAASARARGEVLVSEPFARRFSAADGSAVDAADAVGAAAVSRGRRLPRLLERSRNGRHGPRALPLDLPRPARHEPGRPRARPASSPAELRRRILAAAAGRLRPDDHDQPRAPPRGPRDLRPDLRRHAGTRGDRGRRRGARDRERPDGLGRRAPPDVRTAARDRRIGGADPQRHARARRSSRGLTGTLAAAAAGAAFAWLLLDGDQPAVVRLDGGARRARQDARSARRPSCSWPPCSPASDRDASRRPSIRRRRWRKNETRASRCSRRGGSPALVAGGARRSFPARPRLAPDVPLEWWYWTGHLQGAARTGVRFSAHVLPPPRRPPRPLRLVGRLVGTLRVRREGAPRAARHRRRLGEGARRFQRRLVGARGEGDDRSSGRARAKGRSHSRSPPRKPPVLHGEAGISRKGPGPDEYSRYVSITRLNVSGHAGARDGKTEALTGKAWFDHEWGPGGLPAGYRGLGLVRARARRRLGAHALSDAPDRRPRPRPFPRAPSFRPSGAAACRSRGRTSVSRRKRRGPRPDRRRSIPPSGSLRSRRSASRSRSRRCSPTRSS